MENTYLQPSELLVRWPNVSRFTSTQISASLQDSYSMVNSYLNSNLTIPAIDEDGTTPAILKVNQLKFAMYLLKLGNIGQTDELQSLYDKTAETLRKITTNELLISEIQTTPLDIGWNISENNLSTNSGSIFISGIPPTVEIEYTFEVTSAGTTWVTDTTFEVKRGDSDSVVDTITGDWDEWIDVDSYGLTIRFDGQFMNGETFKVKGIPDTANVVSSANIIKQSTIIY